MTSRRSAWSRLNGWRVLVELWRQPEPPEFHWRLLRYFCWTRAAVALLLVGYVWLAVVVGGLLLDRVKPETAALTAWRAGAAVLAMLALALLTRLPFVGGLVVFAALVVGVGMVVAVVIRRTNGNAPVPAA